jgi:hypothetical protein
MNWLDCLLIKLKCVHNILPIGIARVAPESIPKAKDKLLNIPICSLWSSSTYFGARMAH